MTSKHNTLPASQRKILEALRNPALPKQFVEAFWRAHWEDGLLEVAILEERADLTEDIIHEALTSPRVEVRCAVARHQRLSPHHLDILSHDVEPAVRVALSRNPYYREFLKERQPKHLTRVKMEIDGEVRTSLVMRTGYSPIGFGKMKAGLGLVNRNQWRGEGSGYYFLTKNDVCVIVFAYKSYPGDSDAFTLEFFGVDYESKVSQLERIAERNPWC